ncbi:MAG: NUDIX hydrolase [Actinomycetota bacterium]|nr:NUDIX hydrolase [Actinomycetota bacterium]
MNKKLNEIKISSEEIFKGEIIKLYFDRVKLPDGRIATREKISHPGAVAIVPLNKNGNIFFVRQFRYPINDILIEIPAGKIDKNEDPLDSARRELEEEIGASGGELKHLISFYSSPGFCDEIMHIYLAVDFVKKENNLEEDEFLEVIELKIEDALSYIKSGKIKDAKTIIGILLTCDYITGENRIL